MEKVRTRHLTSRTAAPTMILALDHGFSMSELGALWQPKELIAKIGKYFDSIIVHKGLVPHVPFDQIDHPLGLIVHLSGSTQYSQTDYKVPVCSVEEAIALGADGISIHVNFGGPNEQRMLADAAKISREAKLCGLPLLIMSYNKSQNNRDELDAEYLCRVSLELGADMVKVLNPNTDSFYKFIGKFEIPILLAGGKPEMSKGAPCLEHFRTAIEHGARGFAVGRTVFLSADPISTSKSIRSCYG